MRRCRTSRYERVRTSGLTTAALVVAGKGVGSVTHRRQCSCMLQMRDAAMTAAAFAVPMAAVLPNLHDADPEPPVKERVGNNRDLADRLAREQSARRRPQQGDVAVA
jgi:hypothetical protein